MYDTLEADFRIVTPMFIGGASQKPEGVRPPSVKGALRFWWRALNWAKCLEHEGRVVPALKLLHRREADLFGSAAREKEGGQASILLEVNQHEQRPSEKSWPAKKTGSAYLAFGLMETGSTQKNNYQPHREALPEGVEFTVTIGIRRPVSGLVDTRQSIVEALETWSLFGGLGSRSRRGFGSVTLQRLDGQDRPLDREKYEDMVKSVLRKTRGANPSPPLSAFTEGTRFSILTNAESARDAHGKAGQLYENHRGLPSSLRGKVKIPFGLPLQGIDSKRRRASPLFFHVHELADGSHVAGALFLPAFFHAEYPSVSYKDVERFVTAGEEVV
jgi:CRISPR-associated protein Cmr1